MLIAEGPDTMETRDASVGQHALAPIHGGAPYSLSLSDEMLSLQADDGHTVLLLPREEAARYLHFEWDLRRGRIVQFRLLGGLRSMRFLCASATVSALAAWLPLGESWIFPEQTVLVLAAGVAGLVWAPLRLLGGAVLGVALLTLFPWRRNLALVNAIACGAGAAVAMFGPSFGYFASFPPGAYLYGALLAVAAIEQLGHTGPNHFVFASRRAAMHLVPGRHRSALVHRVAYASGAGALAFATLGAVLSFAPLLPSPSEGAFYDAPVFLMAALALAAPLPLLLMRRRAPYGEALLLAQLLIAVMTVYAWGLGQLFVIEDAVTYTGDAFARAIANPARPYFALPLLLLEWAFRRWFVRAAEREAAEAD